MGRCYACRLAHGNYSFAMPSVPAAHVAVVAAARGVQPAAPTPRAPDLARPMPPAFVPPGADAVPASASLVRGGTDSVQHGTGFVRAGTSLVQAGTDWV